MAALRGGSSQMPCVSGEESVPRQRSHERPTWTWKRHGAQRGSTSPDRISSCEQALNSEGTAFPDLRDEHASTIGSKDGGSSTKGLLEAWNLSTGIKTNRHRKSGTTRASDYLQGLSFGDSRSGGHGGSRKGCEGRGRGLGVPVSELLSQRKIKYVHGLALGR